jgi:hypothetical protein
LRRGPGPATPPQPQPATPAPTRSPTVGRRPPRLPERKRKGVDRCMALAAMMQWPLLIGCFASREAATPGLYGGCPGGLQADRGSPLSATSTGPSPVLRRIAVVTGSAVLSGARRQPSRRVRSASAAATPPICSRRPILKQSARLGIDSVQVRVPCLEEAR